MQKTKTIALALILFLGICTTPALAITASDEEIITKAVAAALQAVEASRTTSNVDTSISSNKNTVSIDDVLKNLDPREQITIESLQRIEQILKNQKASEASNLGASILDAPNSSNTTSNSEAIASAMETIRDLQQSKYAKDTSTTSNTTEEKTTEDKIEITPISPDLLRSSAEPLMQFSRSLTRKAASPLDVATDTKTNILAADEKAVGERVAAEAYHRAADEEATSIFSTQNLIVLGISLAFLIAGIVLFFIHFEKKLLITNGKFEHLSFFQKDHNKTIL
ncbi:MAG: hypothetical protein PHO48_04380 [Candidatus Gracilibacteria bacterium]|nr:hypothetical protein [Candidatus Gracilibacteria bacterium]MDD5179536.1 hypothetical protein [Candidatus Gracilibacteria bacterium]